VRTAKRPGAAQEFERLLAVNQQHP